MSRIVSIDVDEAPDVSRLTAAVVVAADRAGLRFVSLNSLFTDERNDVIRAALIEYAEPPKPPRPEEPTGLGAVIEDSRNTQWVHFGNGCWIKEVPNAALEQSGWDSIDVVRVVHEGVIA